MSKNSVQWYVSAAIAGLLAGYFNIPFLTNIGLTISTIFMRIFKCLSMPILSLSVISALSSFNSNNHNSKIWKKTLLYTTITTLFAASTAAIIYQLISPPNSEILTNNNIVHEVKSINFTKYLLDIIPEDIFSAFSEHKVFSVLLFSLIFGLAIRGIESPQIRAITQNLFQGLYHIFFIITKFIVNILPFGFFGFICYGVQEVRNGFDFKELGAYFLVIILANLVQGCIILPSWLLLKRLKPVNIFKGVAPALSVALFSKSSAGALPVTISAAENRLKILPQVSKFVLPICTTINMNGCAAFIYSTVVFVMQNHGIEVGIWQSLSWIFIASIAAIGNASIPLGCFFMSASLLSTMNIPMSLIGIILPFYSIIDMLETALNVWSDSCIAAVIDRDYKLKINA